MFRMQYHFESPDDAQHDEMRAGALEAARIAQEHGLEPPAVLVSHDEHPRRLVIEFTGTDQWECDAKQRAGQEIPELSEVLANVFKGRMSRVEVYEVLGLSDED